MATLSAKLSAPRVSYPSTPVTRLLSLDINALEGSLRRLQGMRDDLRPGIVVMGPGRAGRDALDALDAPALLDELIRTYEMAIADLADQHTEADIAETTAGMFAATGSARADYRRYLRDLIETYRATCGTLRAAEVIHGHRETVGARRAA